jgi:hypothetical protein
MMLRVSCLNSSRNGKGNQQHALLQLGLRQLNTAMHVIVQGSRQLYSLLLVLLQK